MKVLDTVWWSTQALEDSNSDCRVLTHHNSTTALRCPSRWPELFSTGGENQGQYTYLSPRSSTLSQMVTRERRLWAGRALGSRLVLAHDLEPLAKLAPPFGPASAPRGWSHINGVIG